MPILNSIQFFSRTMAEPLARAVEARTVTQEGAATITALYARAAEAEAEASRKLSEIHADPNLTATGKAKAARTLGQDMVEKLTPIRQKIAATLAEVAEKEARYPFLVRDGNDYRDVRAPATTNERLERARVDYLLQMDPVERGATLRHLAETDADEDGLIECALRQPGFLRRQLLDEASERAIVESRLTHSGLREPLEQSRYTASALGRLEQHITSLLKELGVEPPPQPFQRLETDNTLTPSTGTLPGPDVA